MDIFYLLDAARALVPVATLVLEVAENTLSAVGSPESVSGGRGEASEAKSKRFGFDFFSSFDPHKNSSI